jgi:hypothetical protein
MAEKTKRAKPKTKKRKRPIKVPVAPHPHFCYVFRVNKRRTIYWLMPKAYPSLIEAEQEAQRLSFLDLVKGKNQGLYIALEGDAALYLWIGYDVRQG